MAREILHFHIDVDSLVYFDFFGCIFAVSSWLERGILMHNKAIQSNLGLVYSKTIVMDYFDSRYPRLFDCGHWMWVSKAVVVLV